MKQSQWEFVILKPTDVFYSFLTAQLPEAHLPDKSLLQYNNTAYLFNKQPDEEAMLDEIEKHYPSMFRHEIQRWLGCNAHHAIENNFLDFLCCFKFEFHSQIVLMEQSMTQGKQLLSIKPRAILLNWLKDCIDDAPDLAAIVEKVNVQQMAENGTVIVKNFNAVENVKPFLEDNYRVLFETEMLRMNDQSDSWPQVRSYTDFSRYFSVGIHTQLIHLNAGVQ